MSFEPKAHPAISSFEVCHIGSMRSHNEDAVLSLLEQGLWAVADGMGGHERGDYASQLVISSLLEMASSLDGPLDTRFVNIQRALQHTSEQLVAAAKQISAETVIGTTVVVVAVHGDELGCLWAGDSRAYRLRGQTLTQLTTDHTVANELIRDTGMTRDDASCVQGAEALTTAVGASSFTPEILYEKVQPGDRICLCSDGLNKMVADWEIESALKAREGPEAATRHLLGLSLDRQATDNVSIIVVDYG